MAMTPLLVLGGYFAVFVVVARIAYRRFDAAAPADDNNGFGATFVGLLWPLTLTALTLGWLWQHTIGRETPRQRRERLKQEAETLRMEARKLGLDVPALYTRDGDE
jgi:hypothetical protein